MIKLCKLIPYLIALLATNIYSMEVDLPDSSPIQSGDVEQMAQAESPSVDDGRTTKKRKMEKSTKDDFLLFSFINLTSETVNCTLFPECHDYDSCYGGSSEALGDKRGHMMVFDFNGKINYFYLSNINGEFSDEKILFRRLKDKEIENDPYYILAAKLETPEKRKIILSHLLNKYSLAGGNYGWGKCCVLHPIGFYNPYDHCGLYDPPKVKNKNLLVFSEVDIDSFIYKVCVLKNTTNDNFYHFPLELKKMIYGDLFLCSLTVGRFKSFYNGC